MSGIVKFNKHKFCYLTTVVDQVVVPHVHLHFLAKDSCLSHDSPGCLPPVVGLGKEPFKNMTYRQAALFVL